MIRTISLTDYVVPGTMASSQRAHPGWREKGAAIMEGSSMREFPRMVLDKPVELTIGEQQIKVENPSNNLSAGGVFVRRADLPAGTAVRVRIPVNSHHFEADGQIRSVAPREAGAGISFTAAPDGPNPQRLVMRSNAQSI